MQRKLLWATCVVLSGFAGQAAAQVSCAGVPAFQSCTAYASGASVVFGGAKYTAVTAIAATRDCPPSSPYDPSTDNWWTNNGTCSTGATATATTPPTTPPQTPTATRPPATATATAARQRATATATATVSTRPTATRTSTATATPSPTATPVATPWALNVFYNVGVYVTYDGALYECLYPHTSRVGLEPPNAPAFWALHLGTPVLTVTNGILNCKGGVSTAIHLSWKTVPAAASYMIEWGRSSSSTLTPIVWSLPATATSYDFPDASMAGVYHVRAAAQNWLNATYSDTVAGTFVPYSGSCPATCPAPVPLGRPAPAVPTNVTGSTNSGNMNQIQWDTTGAESDFHVFRSTTSGGPYGLLGVVDKTAGNYQDYETIINKPYYYVVRNVYHYTQGTGGCQQIYEMDSPNSAEVNALTGNP
jgi:hypothetical protein